MHRSGGVPPSLDAPVGEEGDAELAVSSRIRASPIRRRGLRHPRERDLAEILDAMDERDARS